MYLYMYFVSCILISYNFLLLFFITYLLFIIYYLLSLIFTFSFPFFQDKSIKQNLKTNIRVIRINYEIISSLIKKYIYDFYN